MTICIDAEFLAHVKTSGNPFRGMVRQLVRLRRGDHFVFFVRRGSERAPLLSELLQSLSSANTRVVADWKPRWLCNALALVKYRGYRTIEFPADFYLSLDLDSMGPKVSPSLYTVQDLSTVREPKHSSMRWHGVRIRRFAVRLLERGSSPVAALSEFTRQDLIRYSARFSERTTVIHCGIDECWFEQGSSALPQPGNSFQRPYWIWYGHVTRRKNVDGLLRGYALLGNEVGNGNQIPDLVVVGTLGHDSTELPALARTLGIAERVHFLPYQSNQNDLVRLVAGSQGLLLPSHYEGFGLPCIEAMALGLPALVSNRTCQPEISGGFAVLCDPSSDRSVADGLNQLRHRSQFAPEAVAARKRWAAQFTHERAAKAYSALIDQYAVPQKTFPEV